MPSYDEINQYCQTVCEQIRWKKSHQMITEEIGQHICDQRDAYIQEGDSKDTATHKAVLEMGDAVEIGVALDKTHRPKAQWFMLGTAILFMAIGLFANYYITQFLIPGDYGPLFPNIFLYFVALVLLFVCYFLDFTFLGKYAFLCYIAAVIISIIGSSFGVRVNGMSFLRLGPFNMSMASLAIAYPMLFALIIYTFRNKGYGGLVLSELAYLPLAAVLLSTAPNMSFVLFTLSATILLCLAVIKGWFCMNKKLGLWIVILPAAAMFMILIIYCMNSPYYIQRLTALLDPYSVKEGSGFWYCQIRDMLKYSRIIGEGAMPGSTNFIGNPTSAYLYRTDYILTALTYQFGWMAGISIIAVIALFSLLGIRGVMKQKSVLGTLVSASVLLPFMFHCIFYIVCNLGYGTPTLPLPLISYGNTALLLNAALIGFMLSVFRTGELHMDKTAANKPSSRIQFEKGKLTIDLNFAQK